MRLAARCGPHPVQARARAAGGGPSVAVVGQQYCAPMEQVYLLKEKLGSISGDDFTIVNPHDPSKGFKLDSKAMSMSGSRTLKALHGGSVLVHMKHKARAACAAWAGCQPALPQHMCARSESGAGLSCLNVLLLHASHELPGAALPAAGGDLVF